MYWLICFQPSTTRLLICDEYRNPHLALNHRFDWEGYFEGLGVEVVVIGAESFDMLRARHSRYFAGASADEIRAVSVPWFS